MSVYVDQLRPREPKSRMDSCHMVTDTDEELEAMATRLALHPHWRDRDHYDLDTYLRNTAIKYGAIEITARKLARLRKARKHPAKTD